MTDGLKGADWGQAIYSFGVSPHNKNIVLAATDTVGVWRSEDGGLNWQNTSDGLIYPYTNDVMFDKLDDGVVYLVSAGSKNSVNENATDMGIYKSSDNGKTWVKDLPAKYTLVNLGGRKQLYWQEYGGKTYLYAATMGSGIYRKEVSTANAQWEQIYNGTESFYDIYADSTGLILAVSPSGILTSTDNGAGWNEIIVPEVSSKKIEPRAITVYPDDNKIWYIVDAKSLYQTTDSGANWSLVDDKVKSTDASNLVNVKILGYKADGKDYRMYFSASELSAPIRYADDMGVSQFEIPKYYNPDKTQKTSEGYWPHFIDVVDGSFYVINEGLAESSDGGATYNIKKSQGLSGYPMTDIAFDADGMPKLLSFIDAGLYTTEVSNVKGEIYPTVVPLTTFPRYSYNANTDVSDYVNGSRSSPTVVADPNDAQHILSITGSYGYDGNTSVIQSTDGGDSWNPIVDKDGNKIGEHNGISFIKYDPKNSNVIYARNLKSVDNGKTWSALTDMPYIPDDTSTEDVNEAKYSSIVDVSKDGKLLARLPGEKCIYISSDGGQNWIRYDISTDKTDGFGVMKFDADGKNVWMNGYKYLYKYNFDTNELSEMDRDIFYSVQFIAQNPNNANHMLVIVRDVSYYRTSGNTIYETRDGGKTWLTIEGYPNIANAVSVIFHPTKPLAYIGTYTGIIIYKHGIK